MECFSEYLLPCDAHFYAHYAKPLVCAHSSQFDLDVFDTFNNNNNNNNYYNTTTTATTATATATTTSHDNNDNTSPGVDFTQTFVEFQNDPTAQYEMHPKFGRYVWDIGDQWYQKWNLIFSMENMWQWSGQIPTQSQDPYSLEMLQPWLNHITERHCIHPHHRQLLENICDYLFDWQKSNKPLSNCNAGTSRLNTIPFYPPSWFVDKERQNHVEKGDTLAPSYFASFVPPYRINGHTPERWDRVFLKGLTFDPTNEKFDMDPTFIARIIPLYGLTVHYDEATGYSYLMMVMRKASFGNLETNIETVIPTDYQKTRRQALSIAKAVKDLHWEYIHGNVHPRNILFNFDDTIGELVDATFMQRKKSTPSIAAPSGRWPYVAPEVAQGLSGPTTEADIYSIGVILWQLISRVTFPANAPVDPWVFRIEPIPGVLSEWEQLYADCLSPDPAKRPSAYMMNITAPPVVSVSASTPENKLESPLPLASISVPTSTTSLSSLSTSSSNTLPMSQDTLDYIHQRRKEINEFMEKHKGNFSSSHQRLTKIRDDVILTASVTRSINHGLESYPSPLQGFF
ncbi:kinase-like domain-containing protein [Chlamydoabsidia padenii]|nr:kinase-like domain-containing protein [Chlamydoabsidia padenii]